MSNFFKAALALVVVLIIFMLLAVIFFGFNETFTLVIAYTGMYIMEYALSVVCILFPISLAAALYLIKKV